MPVFSEDDIDLHDSATCSFNPFSISDHSICERSFKTREVLMGVMVEVVQEVLFWVVHLAPSLI